MSFGLYLHLPYCRSICPYCAFATAPLRRAEPARLLAAFAREVDGARRVEASHRGLGPDEAWRRPRTVYIGGGTPTALDRETLTRLLDWMHATFDLSAVREWTVEANPEGLEEGILRLLRDAGADRLSLGIQSLEPGVLKTLGRTHDAATALDAVERARAAGFERLSVDLMVAVPGETEEGLLAGLGALMSRGVGHVSAYSLQVEEGTPFAAKAARGALVTPGDDVAADRYALLDEFLARAGLAHYEVSNYARRGEESRHNEGYWIRRPYLGVGPGAHSFDGARRWANEHDTRRYMARIESAGNARGGEVAVDSRDAAEEEIFLALRRTRGIRRARLLALAGSAAEAWIAWGVDGGALTSETPGRIRPTARGLLTAHELATELFLRMPPSQRPDLHAEQRNRSAAAGAP